MSLMAAMTAAAPILIPAAIGAAGGMGIGALTGDGFSDDDWWQGMLMGGLTGGIGGGMGMFSPGGGAAAGGKLGGLLGGKSMTGSQLGANLGTGPVNVSSYLGNSAAPSMIDPSMVDPSGMDWTGMWNNVNSAGEYLGTNPDLVGKGTGMFGMHGSMMPSQDTLMKGLLGSQIFKSVAPQSKPTQPGSINRGQRAAPFQPRQPIMLGGGRPQRRSFRRG
jgi:hypothetical protein